MRWLKSAFFAAFLALFAPTFLLLTVYPAAREPTAEAPHEVPFRRGGPRYYPGWAKTFIDWSLPGMFFAGIGGGALLALTRRR
jgi:hypothetical protein